MRYIKTTAVPFALCAVFALGIGLGKQTPDLIAEEKATPPTVAPKGEIPSTDLAKQVAELEKKIAELREERKSTAWSVERATVRAYLSQKAADCACGSYKDVEDDVNTLRAYLLRLETATVAIHTHQDTFAKINGVPAAAYLELTVRDTPKFVFVLRGGMDGADLGTITVSESSEPMLTRVLVRMKADPTMPKELRVVAQPTRFDDGVLKALKACDAAGYKTVTFTGFVPSSEDPPKPNENSDPPWFKWHDEVEKNPAALVEEIEPTPKPLWGFSF